MKTSAIALAFFAALGFTSFALANEISMHQHSLDEVKSVCAKAGGSFSQDARGYYCSTDCKGGQGTDCTVGCKTDQSCVAQVIGARHPTSLLEALQTPTRHARHAR